MHETLKLLIDNPIIRSFQILVSKNKANSYLIKIKAILSDQSILFIREFRSKDFFTYSYHWQTLGGELITRWDNAPHHKEIITFPHHKHSPKARESYSVDLKSVLNEIKQNLNTKNK